MQSHATYPARSSHGHNTVMLRFKRVFGESGRRGFAWRFAWKTQVKRAKPRVAAHHAVKPRRALTYTARASRGKHAALNRR
ncbi:hypothetical protein A6V36_17055 [Paraburkholderia ginsengiterrae]|uniref:Uncharacterized protein n=1 Tax=Paraburkholderia ginsengiterrae TaxID=1462993 RepID=A0A1A9N1N8_9BURK|nr:hypothetical protein A6V37_34720 [Paraburkholderia ginsengiterrae]OAJ63729.1 hypothetical protein A6V36_17055 [Paraburkholderia ginsengiterrae]